jgi:hypothetical protein
MTTTYTNSQVVSIPANCSSIIATVVASAGQNYNSGSSSIGGNGTIISTTITTSTISSYNSLYLNIGTNYSQSSYICAGNTNDTTKLLVISGAGGQSGINHNGGNGGYGSNSLISVTSTFAFSSSGYLAPGFGGNSPADGNGNQGPGENGTISKGGNGAYFNGGGGGGGYGGGGGGGGDSNNGGTGGSGTSGSNGNGFGHGKGGAYITGGNAGNNNAGRGGDGFFGGGGGATYSIDYGKTGSGGGGSSFSIFPATFNSASNATSGSPYGYITLEFVITITDIISNISTIENWTSYVGNSTAQDYNLLSDLIFNSSFAGNLMIQSGKIFNGYNNTIYLNNLSSFNGLFNLHTGNVTTIIKNLNVIISNVVLNENKGFLVNGSNNNTIVSNGMIQYVNLVFKDSIMGNNCSGLIGSCGKNININNSYVNGNISGINSGGLIGNNCSNAIINSSYIIGKIQTGASGLVGNNSTITSITNSYCISTNPSITLSGTTILSQNNVYNATLQELL